MTDRRPGVPRSAREAGRDSRADVGGADFLVGGGEMAALIRSFDWARTPVGPPDTWPQSLRTTLSIMLASGYPMAIGWGPDYTFFYNDGYRPILGATKHPGALGIPTREVFPEIWDFVGPLFDRVTREGGEISARDQLLPLDRNGYREECYFDFSYSAIRGESGGVSGVFVTCSEKTAQVLGQRRLSALRDLGAWAGEAKTVDGACRGTARILAAYAADVPFALIYLAECDVTERERQPARLAATAGISAERAAELGSWDVEDVLATGQSRLVDDVQGRIGILDGGPWPAAPAQALALPIPSPGMEPPLGVLVAGVSARLALDDDYRAFLGLVAGQVGTAVANARAHEEERRRADALAELDRAKTAFFSNVSHEFRTPLTLALGPIEDALADAEHPLPAEQRERLEIAHRASVRLLKLVNSLLDFARIEAGRIQASYEPTDLAAATADLASVFRSAIERAGLRLVVDCPPLSEPVYVDRDMWEKIVLNLLSNAFKFTFHGEIRVTLRRQGEAAALEVRDTGVGIPEDELPRLFERFHRVEGTRARTHEGTGIGLALVQELARLHAGTVEVASEVGMGSTFVVRLPLGTAHLPAERVRAPRTLSSTALGVVPYVEEALRWLPEETESRGDVPTRGPGDPGIRGESDPGIWERKVGETPGILVAGEPAPRFLSGSASPRPRVLVADDNADMRAYVQRLLRGRYEVETVADGLAALAVVRERRPDLVLADVMMPDLDGFGLIETLRADPRTNTLPVILLSARAGEEARVEGLRAGADDYLVKPFSARELLARVGGLIELSRVRREAERDLRAAVAREEAARVEAEAAVRARDEFLSVAAHELKTPITSLSGTAQLQLRRLDLTGQLDPDQVARAYRLFAQQSAKLVALINQLLDVSRIAVGKLALQTGPEDVGALVREVADLARGRSERHPIVVRAAGPVIASVDRLRLEQVITNLLDNAIKYSPKGGDIHVEIDPPSGGLVAIRVRDHGLGIAPEHRAHIFERFYQVHRDPSLAGMGLGLYVSREIVELHGGRIRAEFPPDGGSCFVVELPLAEADARRGPQDGAPAGSDGERST